jgi:pimeloyl-ACP methyl ester carboxylesterase
MRIIVQRQFAEPEATNDDEALIVHQRESRADYLAVFVHGLGGKRYGEDSTWGSFPKLVFEQFSAIDIGLYSYRSLFKRLIFWKSIDLDREAEVLGGLLSSLVEYKGFILLGHSMGGLLCKCVVAQLVTLRQEEVAERIKGLFLMASPQLGSLRLPGWLCWLSKDFQALKPHSKLASNVTNVFQEHIYTEVDHAPEGKLHLPVWALVAAEDFWVDPLSAGIGLTREQKRVVRGTHGSVVKPVSVESDSFIFVRSCLESAIFNREEPFRSYRCYPARSSDLLLIHQLACKAFPGPVSSLDLMHQWWHSNDRVFCILRRITVSTGSLTEEVAGYYCILPLKREAVEKICRAEVTGANIGADLLARVNEDVDTFYVAAVVGSNAISKGVILHFLTARFEALAEDNAITVLGRPATDDGLRTIKGYGMTPVEGSSRPGLASVYRYQFETRGRPQYTAE